MLRILPNLTPGPTALPNSMRARTSSTQPRSSILFPQSPISVRQMTALSLSGRASEVRPVEEMLFRLSTSARSCGSACPHMASARNPQPSSETELCSRTRSVIFLSLPLRATCAMAPAARSPMYDPSARSRSRGAAPCSKAAHSSIAPGSPTRLRPRLSSSSLGAPPGRISASASAAAPLSLMKLPRRSSTRSTPQPFSEKHELASAFTPPSATCVARSSSERSVVESGGDTGIASSGGGATNALPGSR
mmetsp:Transcript_33437/g.73377  ORF Transcript_33437/g.73377 Transcript_33437/m.73377 type:complete len:249 (-) Transcript_33437:1226-1972(-)